MNAKDAIDLNCAIIQALGFDPKTIAKDPPPIITLETIGPVITLRHYCHDAAGNKFLDPEGNVASITRKYKLVAVEDPT